MQEEAMKENPGAVHAQVPVDVASFLLNEKRAEIQKLEARLKVNIVMVPNQHLETPHYKVQRRRHDELNEMEHVPSSYEMVERPEEPKAPGAETAEAKVERQQPVVKTIPPSEPAPIVDESLPRPPRAQQQARPAPQPSPIVQPVVVAAAAASAGVGFFSRMLSIFKPPTPAPAPIQTAPVPAGQPTPAQRDPRRDHQRGDGRGGRGGRYGRGGRGRARHRATGAGRRPQRQGPRQHPPTRPL